MHWAKYCGGAPVFGLSINDMPFHKRFPMPVPGVPGADEGPEDEQNEDEDWTTDDERTEEAEQISKAKSMAAVLKSSKGILTFFVHAHRPAACLAPPPFAIAQRET